MTETHDSILDLDALAPKREQARIRTDADPDGTIYELAAPADFGAVALAELSRIFTEHDELWEKAKRSAAEDKRLEKLLDELAQRLIPDAPAAAIAALPALTKRMVAVRFFVAAGQATASLMPGLPSPPENS